MTTETTNTLTDLLSQIPEKIQNMYEIDKIADKECLAIKHPFWIFLEEKNIREITIGEMVTTIKSKHLAIILYNNKVDAQVIEF